MYTALYMFMMMAKEVSCSILQHQAAKNEQVWLGVTMESPEPENLHGKEIDGVFHWIGTYRKDADVLFPYGQFGRVGQTNNLANVAIKSWEYQNLYPQPAAFFQQEHVHFRELSQKNKKLAAWMVSHCETSSYTESY